jgi:hypothetical protein
VLVHGDDVYHLEKQNLAEPFVDQPVKISGTLGGNDGKTIQYLEN